MQASSTTEDPVNTSTGSHHRCFDINSPGSSPGSTTLLGPPSTKNQRVSPPPLIQVGDNPGEAECDGLELVDQQPGDHQWEINSSGATRYDNRIRYFEYRLGSLLEQTENGQPLVIPGISASYQCQGAASSLSSSPDLCGKQERNSCSPESRQHDSSLLYQSDGGHPLQEAYGNHIPNLELEFGQENFPVSRTPSRHPECGCRPGITKETGQLRMEAGPIDISTNHANSRSLSGGSLCFQNISSTSKIYELETRPRSNSNRCSESALDKHRRVCLSSVLTDRQVPFQDSEGGNQRDDTHCTSMANSAMVCSSSINAVSETTPPTETAVTSYESQQRVIH